jgi:hypothetical protein
MRRRTVLLIFAAAFCLRMAAAWVSGALRGMELVPGTEMENIAASLVRTGEYANPYHAAATGLSAHASPLYPLYLAALYALLGTGAASALARVVITCIVSSLRAVLLLKFGLDAGLGRAVSLTAAVMSVVYAGALTTEVAGHTDNAWMSVALLGLLWMALRLWRDGTWKTRAPWRFFALCGFCTLLNPAMLPVIGVLVVAGAIVCGGQWRARYLGQAALLAATIVMVLLPWALRNRMSLGKTIWTRDNFGLEFWLSNGPGRTYDLPHNIGFGEHEVAEHPFFSLEEAERVAAAGEVKYNEQRLDETLGWARENPAEFLMLTARRFLAWWFPPGSFIVVAIKGVLTTLAFAGLWMLFRLQPLVGWLCLLTWISFPDVYYVIQWSSRYRVPMDWQLLLCAAVALTTVWIRVRGRDRASAAVQAAGG